MVRCTCYFLWLNDLYYHFIYIFIYNYLLLVQVKVYSKYLRVGALACSRSWLGATVPVLSHLLWPTTVMKTIFKNLTSVLQMMAMPSDTKIQAFLRLNATSRLLVEACLEESAQPVCEKILNSIWSCYQIMWKYWIVVIIALLGLFFGCFLLHLR